MERPGWTRDPMRTSLRGPTELGAAPVSNPDEGLYAEVPGEMLESGDLVPPRFNYARYPDKPPMLYWVTAASYWFGGESEFTARLASAATGVLADPGASAVPPVEGLDVFRELGSKQGGRIFANR